MTHYWYETMQAGYCAFSKKSAAVKSAQRDAADAGESILVYRGTQVAGQRPVATVRADLPTHTDHCCDPLLYGWDE